MNNSYTMFILTSGRHGYLDRTIMSWELNLLDQPKYKIIFDDSGDERFYQYLQKKYSDRFLIVKIDKDQVGQKRAVQFIFDYVSKLDAQYTFLNLKKTGFYLDQ